MSDATHEAPEQIWAWGWRADSVWQEQTWQHEDEPMSTMKYILATPAALAEASEVQALIAEAVEKATRIKPLVWEEREGKSYRQANCIFGQYQISWLGEFECWQLSSPHKPGQSWRDTFSRHSHKDDAKAAAQADYEQRIRAAIGGTEND